MNFKVTLGGVRVTNYAVKKAVSIIYSKFVSRLSFPALKTSDSADITSKVLHFVQNVR
jgi:hypothetical protein